MNKSSIDPSCLQQVFDSASNASAKGQAQYFTPLEWATVLCTALVHHRPVVVDLQCGNGDLLSAASNRTTKRTLGCDIDLEFSGEHHVKADLTLFYSLLKTVGFEADLFVLNPPWDLHWHRERLARLADSECNAVREAFKARDPRLSPDDIDSTIATLCIALDLCSVYGEGFLIANAATLDRLIFAPNAPHRALASHIWAHIIVDGNICVPAARSESFRTSIIYFARGHYRGMRCLHQNFDNRKAVLDYCQSLFKQRLHLRQGPEVRYTHVQFSETEPDQIVDRWTAAAQEWQRTSNDKPLWNIYLALDGTIATHLSLFDDFSGRISKDYAAKLNELNGKHPMQLVIQRSHRKALERACGLNGASPFRVAPDLIAAVQKAILDYNAIRAPLYPLPTVQRLGYLDEHDDILCTKDLAPGFFKGTRYPLRSTTIRVRRKGEKRNIMGELDDVEYDGQELAFFIQSAGRELCFMDARLRDKSVRTFTPKPNVKIKSATALRTLDDSTECEPCKIDFTLQDLVEHFEIPHVPDVAELHPDRYQAHVKTLQDIEALLS